jgi:sugar phosphate isomerase/epimerase
MRRRIGVCSWSLEPRSAAELVLRLRAVGVSCVQLALDPLRSGAWPLGESVECLRRAGIEIASGMMAMRGEDYSTLESIRRTGGVRADEHWEHNRRAARENARLARELGLGLVTFHAGFLPDERADPERARLLERLREIVDAFAAEGVAIALETGQETAETLAAALADLDRPAAGVNFDPANLILYDKGDPVAALERLAVRVRQIHVKDAVRTRVRGMWGEEVPVGRGEVDWQRFFDVVRQHGLEVDLLIEREAGTDRLADIRGARERVEAELASAPTR